MSWTKYKDSGKIVTLRKLMHKAQVRSNFVGIVTSGSILTILGLFALINLADHNEKLVSRVLSYTLEAAVVFKDKEAIREGINIITETEKLSGVLVLDESGNTLYEWNTEEQSQWVRLEREILSFMLDQPSTVSITHNGTSVGSIQVYTNGTIFFIFMLCGFLAVALSLIFSTIGANIEGSRINEFICKSVRELASIARRIARERAFELRAPQCSIYEIRELAEDLNILLDEIETWEGHLQKENDSLSYRANHDSLTGLSNRSVFEAELTRQVDASLENNSKFALIYIDGYRFKNVNDTYGHAAGDEVLMATAKRLKSLIREGDLLARLGGDEFAMLIRPLKNENDLEAISRKIVGSMQHPIAVDDGQRIDFSLTVGGVIFPEHGSNSKDIVNAADSAMYKAKKSNTDYFVGKVS